MNDRTERLVQSIIDSDNMKRDEIAEARAVRYGALAFWFNGQYIETTETAERQLCAMNGIPYSFFKDVMRNDERTQVFNRLCQERGDTEHQFRFHGNTLYGVVSPKYKKIDNIRVLDVLQAASDSGVGLKPIKWTLSHDHSRFTFVTDKAGVGELTPSITITNSENGLASLSVWAGVYRWVCTNGMMIPVSDITKSRWMHIGNNDITLPDFRVVLNKSMEWTERLYETKSRYLTTEEKSKIVVDISRALGQKAADKVVEVANREYHGGRTLFDTINSVTRTAQYHMRPAQQSEIEKYAHTLLRAA